MKTFKSILAVIALLFTAANVNAANRSSTYKLTKDEVVNMYIDAVAHGDLKGLDGILDDSLHYNVNRGAAVKTMSKYELMDYLKGNPVDPSVNTVITPVTFNDDKAVVTVAFKYGAYTRTETLTLLNEGGWTITNIDAKFS